MQYTDMEKPEPGTARFRTFLRRLLSIKGGVAPRLGNDIVPTIGLLTPPHDLLENGILTGWRGYQVYFGVGPVAAQYPFGMIQNPVGSGHLVVVTRIELPDLAAAYDFYVDLIPGTLFAGTTRQQTRLDTRGADPLTLKGVATAAQGNTLGAPPYQTRYFTRPSGAVGIVSVPCWYVISPGYGLNLERPAVNTPLWANVTWWEREAEASELAAR